MVDERWDQLDARVSALERAIDTAQRADVPTAGVFWALEGLRERTKDGDGGAVLFTGTVDIPTGGHYEWQQGHPAGELLDEDWTLHAERIAALGHPVRLRILRAVLAGTQTAADLTALEGMGTTGQVYHHLRLLASAGWLRASARGSYSVPGERVVPLLTVLAAARR